MAKGKKSGPGNTPEAAPPAPVAPALDPVFPIVAIGASAGGLKPFLDLLRALPDRPGMALIFLLHQEKSAGTLPEVVSRATKMEVRAVAHGMPIEPNRVYVAPAHAEVIVERGRFLLGPGDGAQALPIDILFRSLAEDQAGRAVGIVLSGTASDGMMGARAIKAEGGITFAQDESAQFGQMPEAAIAAGAIDFVLPPYEIASELLHITRTACLTEGQVHFPEREMTAVFSMLRASQGVDFAHYKPATIMRRIRRRMAIRKVHDLPAYLALLREDKAEVDHLYHDILIRVTGFFRDPSVFDTLRKDILPVLLRDRTHDKTIRVWVPGCATGEEVYSLAVALLEAAHDLGVRCPIQIFGTDVSDASIDRARLGVYPENIREEVSAERLRQFFTAVSGGYRVKKAVRDCCVFARQNVTNDPPFSRLDVISCRNVMIYLGAVLQRKVMSIFHYALRPKGYLLLGSSESIGSYVDMFGAVDRKHKIYQKKSSEVRIPVDFHHTVRREPVERPRMEDEATNAATIFREADRLMLSRFSPPGVLINENMEILQFRGRTSQFLEPPAGVASFNLLKMAREGLLGDLRSAILAARKKEEPVRRDEVRVKTNGSSTLVNIEVIPFVSPGKERYQIVLFEEVTEAGGKSRRRKKEAPPEPDTRQGARLKRELEATREYLQSIIEEQEAMNEELRSANEEIQSSNEELQSTNEELETAKEELQSSNEELITLNEELENRNQEMGQVNNDLVNLLTAVDLPIVMLDGQLRIRRFNPGAQRTLNLLDSDLGRAITDLRMPLAVDDLDKIIRGVIEDLEARELKTKDRAGHTFLLRIRPYRTADNKIEGAVLVLIDLDLLKKKS